MKPAGARIIPAELRGCDMAKSLASRRGFRLGHRFQLGHRFRPSRRVYRAFAGNVLAAFGAVSAVTQFVGQLFPAGLPHPGEVTLTALGLCVSWGMVRMPSRTRVHRTFKHPRMSVRIETGDIFEREDHLVVGFCDTFDTAISPDGPVHPGSVQGQLLARLYDGDRARLDHDLAAALAGSRPASVERRRHKPVGKLARYPVGTVALLGDGPRHVFAVAYSRLGNDGMARSSVEDLWLSLNQLWDAVYQRGQQDAVAVPLLGAGLARLDFLHQEDILRLILLSFVTRSRERRVCRELTVVIQAADVREIDMPEVAAFLRALGAAGDK